MSASIDYNNDGFVDTVGIEKVVIVKEMIPLSHLVEVVVTVEMKLFFICFQEY